METINRIILDLHGKEYSLVPAEQGTWPLPDSVGTEEIRDGGVEMQDLSDDVRAATENQFATDDDVKAVLGLE